METEKVKDNGQVNPANGTKVSGKRRFRITGFKIASFAIQLIIGLVIIMPNIMIFRYTSWAYLTIKTDKDWFAHTYRIKTAEDFIDRLDDVRKAGEKIIFFEYVGRGSEGSSALMGWGVNVGGGGVFTRLMKPKTNSIAPYLLILEDAESLICEVFDAEATIELEACFTAFNSRSIAYAFKRILPKAHVWGFTLRAYPLPITSVHETFRGRGSEWIEVAGD